MKLKKEYIDINDTLHHIKVQTIDSINFANIVCPDFEHPEDLFYWLKENTTYKNDPRDIELLQTMQTLFNKNYHGIPGAGDCDCFTITAGACFIRCGWNYDIVLVGRDKRNPVHIYTLVYFKNKPYVFDLTNPKFNTERPYKYIQEIPVNWRKWKIKGR